MPRKLMPAKASTTSRKTIRKTMEMPLVDLSRLLFEQAEDGIFLCDRTGRCLDVNAAGLRLLGQTRRSLAGLLLTDILRPADGTNRHLQFRGIRRGSIKSFEQYVRRKDGCDLPVDVRAQGVDGGRVLIVMRTRDDRSLLVKQLRELETFLDSMLENLPDMIFIKDAADLRFVRLNKAGEELLGYSRDELLGKNDYDFFPKHEADFFTAKDREVLASGCSLDIPQEPIQTRAHGVRLLHTKKLPILSDDGNPKYLLGLSEDITERYQLGVREDERRQRLKRLTELSLMLSGDPAEVFDQAVRIIGELFSVKVVCLSEIVGRDLYFKSVYIDGQIFRDAGTCPLSVTPCATVEMTKDLRIFDQVMERFPEASFLKDHQAYTYCGFPSLDRAGKVAAVTCLLDDKPHEFSEEDQDILRLFGQRIAVEIDRARDQAERKGMEDRVRASEARLEFLLSSAPAIIYSSMPSGDYGPMFISDNVTKILGYSPDQFIADAGFWADRIHPDDRDRVFAELPDVCEYDTFVHEYRFLHQDGTYRWLRDELRIICDEDKQPIELVGCRTDITKGKQAEKLLVDSEARFRHMVEHLPIGLVSVNQDGVMTMVNAEMENLFGYRRGELIGQSVDCLVPHRFRSTHVPSRQQFLRNPRTERLGVGRDLLGLRKDGTEIQLEIGLTPMDVPQGVQVLTSIVDITGRRQAEEALRESEAKYRRIVETAIEGIWQINEHSRTTFVNRQMAEMLGYRVDEMMGHSLFEFMDEEAKTAARAAVERRRQGVAERHEFKFQRKDGTSVWTSLSTNPLLDEAGRYVGALALVADITQRKSDQDRIEAAERQLREVMDSLFVFVGLFSPDSVFIDANRAPFEAAGLTRDDAIGKRYRDTYWGSDLPDSCRIVEDAIVRAARGEIVRTEVPVRVAHDRVLTMDAFFNPIYNGEGRVVQVVGSGIDITERKQAEEALRASEERYALVMNATNEGIWDWNMSTGCQYLSSAWKAILGLRDEELPNAQLLFFDRVHPDDANHVNQTLALHLEERSPYKIEFRLRHKDGSYRWVSSRGEAMRDTKGIPYRMVGSIRDITERKQTDIMLRAFTHEMSRLSGLDYFQAVVATISKLIGSGLVFIGTFSEDATDRMHMLAVSSDGAIVPNFEYALDGALFEHVFGENCCLYSSGVGKLFPDDRFLEDYGAEGFASLLLWGGHQEKLGVLGIVTRDPVEDIGQFERLLQLASIPVAGEIERQRSEEMLRQNERRLAAAQRIACLGYWSWDVLTDRLEWSDETKAILSYRPEMGNPTVNMFMRFVHPADLPLIQANLEALFKTGHGPDMEYRIIRADGDIRTLLARVEGILDTNGRIVRAFGTIQDITERKQAELALKRQDALLQSFFSQSLDGCFFMMLDEPVEWSATVDKDQMLEQIFARQRFTRVNDAMAVQYGGSREQFLGLTPNDLFADNLSYWKELWRSMLDQGRLAIQTTERKLNGTPMWIEGEYVCLYDEEGRFIGHFGVQREVTAQKRMEEELRSNEARLSEAQHLAKLGNWELDLLSRHLVWSDEIFRIFEIDSTKFGASYEAFLNAVHPDDRATVNDTYTTSVAEHKPYSIVHRLLMPDGRIKYVQEHGETDYDELLRPIRSRGTVQDVTERRLAELQIEKSLCEKETLLREIHHRVKNNLQIISSLLYFQSKKIRDPADLSAFREGQDRLKSMILVHERLYRSDDLMRIEFSDYAKALIDHIRQSYRPVSARIRVVMEISPVVVPVEIALPTGMIVNELLTNVFKYAFPDGREGIVRISVTRLEGGMELVVEDSGVGLPEGFELDRPMTFGLQLIYGLVSQLGGRVSFERQGGTTIRISVPISNGEKTSH